MHRPVRTPES